MNGSIDTQQIFGKWSATAAALGLPTEGINIQAMREVSFTITGLTTETVVCNVSHDQGATWSGNLRPIDATTGALAGNSLITNGTYTLPLNGMRFRWVKSSTSQTAVITAGFRS